MFRPLSLFIGSRYTRAPRRRQFISFISLASLLGLALGVLALIVVLSVMNGFQREMGGRILGLVPHAVISADQPLTHWESLGQRLQGAPGVLGVAPLTEVDAMLFHQGRMQPLQVSGIEPRQEAAVSSLATQLVSGQLADLQGGHFGIIVGQLTANRFGLSVGDKVTLVVPEPSSAPGGISPRMHRFTVAGVFRVGANLDGSLAMVHRADAARLRGWAADQVQGLRLKLEDLYQAPQLARERARALGPNYHASDWTQTQGSLFSAMQMEKTMIGLLLLLIVAVAAFNIIAMLIMVVSDKRMDIAILRTLGATPRQIMAIFMIQGCLIGFAGTLLGAGLGVLAALNISAAVQWLEHTLGSEVLTSQVYLVSSLPSELHGQDVALVVFAGLLLSFLATLYPAWRAAQTQPAEALRYA